MRFARPLTTVLLFQGLLATHVLAQELSLITFAPVSHPVVQTGIVRSAYAWRRTLGDWGESLAEHTLRLQGYDVHQVKLPGNQGIDRIAIKRYETGEVFDLRIVEVKAHRGTKAKLDDTKSGPQLSEGWTRDRLEAMKNSKDPAIQKLGREAEAFGQKKGLQLAKLGEVHDINTRTGTYIRRDARLKELSSDSIERHLKRLQKRGSPQTRAWATSHLAEYDQIRATGEPEFLGETPGIGIREPPHSVTSSARHTPRIPNESPYGFQNPFRRVSKVETMPLKSLARQAVRESTEVEAASMVECLEVNAAKRARKLVLANVEGVLYTPTRVVAQQGVKAGLKRAAIRLAGPIGLAVGVALSAEELASHVLAYRRGEKSYREMCIGISGSLGGIGGAFVGAAWGAYLGAFGGPFAWITSPAGAIIGGVIGYMGGSAAGTALANAWYDHVDEKLKHQLVAWLSRAGTNELVSVSTGLLPRQHVRIMQSKKK